jgi:hypothetical protein
MEFSAKMFSIGAGACREKVTPPTWAARWSVGLVATVAWPAGDDPNGKCLQFDECREFDNTVARRLVGDGCAGTEGGDALRVFSAKFGHIAVIGQTNVDCTVFGTVIASIESRSPQDARSFKEIVP